jgi:predicted Rossmann fold flavoprotein
VTWDVLIVGAGAAGLATGIFTRTFGPSARVLLLDGARSIGAKILVSGGGRCNVTNALVSERDYWGGPPGLVRRVLRAFPEREAAAFFEAIGVALHEEEDGKLFPDSNRARDVLAALLRRLKETGATLRAGTRVTAVARDADGFLVATDAGPIAARHVVLATGGQSLPKSGSDGAGYGMARALGHTIVPTTPALAPLVLDPAPSRDLHREISGVSLDASLALWVDGTVAIRLRGPLLWTHFGISGPVALNMSRHFLRARLDGRDARVTASFVADLDFERLDAFWLAETRARPASLVSSAIARLVPASMAAALLARLAVDGTTQLGSLRRETRRAVTRALLEWDMHVRDSRGYGHAEVTAGGVELREADPATMESRVCPGLFLAGEILDVDGRLGGFNFQWSWSSAYVAGRALGRR